MYLGPPFSLSPGSIRGRTCCMQWLGCAALLSRTWRTRPYTPVSLVPAARQSFYYQPAGWGSFNVHTSKEKKELLPRALKLKQRSHRRVQPLSLLVVAVRWRTHFWKFSVNRTPAIMRGVPLLIPKVFLATFSISYSKCIFCKIDSKTSQCWRRG